MKSKKIMISLLMLNPYQLLSFVTLVSNVEHMMISFCVSANQYISAQQDVNKVTNNMQNSAKKSENNKCKLLN